ncbi:SH3 domain-containing protein [Pararhizobium sp. LjRoot238]|uniref:SH3 domain-containing protein n=1 Tax=Pararhizobium sp. LjRoot238 TaxID=3342293 RepID=UPI003F4FAC64
MRQGPGTTYPAIVTLKKGTRLEVFATDGEWLQVTASRQSGWVHGSFVTDGSPIAAEKSPIKQEAVPAWRLVRTTPENSSRPGGIPRVWAHPKTSSPWISCP